MSEEKYESDYNFANISATKALIFIKFDTSIHKIVKNHQQIFHKDLCIHAHKRRKCVRVRFFVTKLTFVATKGASAPLRLVCAHARTDFYEKSVDDSLLSYE